jgi:hypothetical protein
VQVVQASFQEVPVLGIDIGIGKNLFEKCFAIGFNAGGGVLSAYFFGEREFQVFFKVPFKFLLLLLFEWVFDGNGVFWPVIEAYDGVCAIGAFGTFLDAYEWHVFASWMFPMLFVDVYDQHFGAIGLFDVFDVCMFVGGCALNILGVVFVDQALDDFLDEVGEQIGCNASAYREEGGYEHRVKKLRTFGLGEVCFCEGSSYVVFVPGVCEFF